MAAARDATSFSSSSTSNTNSSYAYDVFINHRGPDVKTGIASHIYHRLNDHGLRVFLDQPELQEGENMTPQIEGAIRTASVHVAIFSPRYAESSWCLKELVLMLESGSTILPVFYHVNPWELRWTRGENGVYAQALSILRCILLCKREDNGVYAPALRMLEKKTTVDAQTNEKKPRHNSSTIEKWRKALSVVAERSGFELNACNGDEGQLVKKVVEQVLKKVSRTPLHVAKYPTGLNDKVKDFETTLLSQQLSEKARVVGIVGLGGVGKTTLAKHFFNLQSSNYDRCCFVCDVRENATKGSLNSLQRTLLNDLAQLNEQIDNTHQGIEKLKRHLSASSLSSLVVLDDVDHIDQLDALFSPLKDTIHPGSLILVTSRNKDVLTSLGIVDSSIYKQTGLNPQDSQKLFCSHAFDQTCPAIGFEQLVEKFVDACDGLPLSLKVIGALVRGKDFEYWKAQLQKISKILPTDIQSKLKSSYDGLDEEEQNIFLDIACFFIGKDRDTAIRVWNGSGWSGWLGFRHLEDRCLVEVDSKNGIIMHDHLRDLGRDLAEKEPPGRQLRLWRHLHYLSGELPVRGINLVHENDPEQIFENLAGSCNLSRLQLLMAGGDFVERIFSVGRFPQLIYLHWENCPNSSLPSSIPLKYLRVLYIEGKYLETLWQDESQAPLQLTELHIYASLSKLPKSIGKLKHLEKIALDSKYLETLPDEFCYIHSLKHVELKGCEKLTLLPDSVGSLTSLQSLDLSGCSTLQVLPDSFGSLTSLQSLDLSRCSTLQALPDSLGRLTSLQSLDLSRCSTLQALPDSLGSLTSLRSLDLKTCSTLKALPDSMGSLTSLQSLQLSGCSILQALPDSVGSLTSLQSFHLSSCSTLQALPDSVGSLTSLQSLDLSGCSTLQTLPDSVGSLTSLQSLNLRGCTNLQALQDSVGSLTSLQMLDLTGCSTLHALPYSVGSLTSLQSFSFSGCTLKALPDSVGRLTNLQNLTLTGCTALQELTYSVGSLTNLQSLGLNCCTALQALPDSVGNLTSLQGLGLNWCSALQVLPDSVGSLTNLHGIGLSWCSSLQALPDSVGSLTSLQTLDLSFCSTLQGLPDSLGSLTSLQSLSLFWCSNLQGLPESMGSLTRLQSLSLGGCSSLQALPESLWNLTSLQSLQLSQCTSWGSALPDSVGNLTSLQRLDLRECSTLQTLPDSLVSLTSLQSLDLIGCSTLQVLPDSLGSLTGLRRLDLSRCSTLKALPGSIGSLTSLELLFLEDCFNLQMLPSVQHLSSLKGLVVYGCPKLQWGAGVVEQLRQRLGKGFSEERP